MLRGLGGLVFTTLLLLAAAAFGPLCAARAQIDPDDAGEGTKLGLAERNNSGQVGTVTLLRRGPDRTLLVLTLFSVPPGRSEPARVERGTCDRPAGAPPAARLTNVEHGRSRSVVPLPIERLASGHYHVAVFASDGSVRVSCGDL